MVERTQITTDEETLLLTEERLMAMPESDYMNMSQLAFFRNRLKGLERRLLESASTTTKTLRETEFVADPMDRATLEEEHALELRTRERERTLLRKIRYALTRIDAGEYGWCEETAESIGIGRLLARPMANLTLEAQVRRELRQKLHSG
ncbi:MAG: RNA polymerase-binding protein DksA [Paralcaligenes sp.]